MKVSRFFQDNTFNVGQICELSDANHRHVVQVLRLQTGDELIIFNGKGGEYLAKLEILSKRKSQVCIQSFDAINRESSLNLTLALAMIKSDKMDFALQKAVELGVNNFQPLYSKRSVIKIKENRLDKKMQHWRGIIIAACEQSGRTSIPSLQKPIALDQYLKVPSSHLMLAMLPGEYSKFKNMDALPSIKKQRVALLIGPEGGFTNEEERQMLKKKLTPVSFGSRILRAETAAIAGITACQQHWGDL